MATDSTSQCVIICVDFTNKSGSHITADKWLKVTTNINKSTQTRLKGTTNINKSTQPRLKVTTNINKSTQPRLKVTTNKH